MVREERHRPHDHLPRHQHDTPLLTLVVAGRHRETFAGRTIELSPFELLAKPAGEPHADRLGAEPGLALLVHASETATAEVREAMDALGVIQLRSVDVAGAVQRATGALRLPDPTRSLGLEGALLELLALVSRRLGGAGSATPSRAVRQAEELISEELHRRLTIAEIAAAVDVSPAGLVRAFRRERGYPIGDYVRRARVAASLRLLTESDAPLADVASRCGFFDQSHLGRVLKRQVGLTPAEVRRGRH